MKMYRGLIILGILIAIFAFVIFFPHQYYLETFPDRTFLLYIFSHGGLFICVPLFICMGIIKLVFKGKSTKYGRIANIVSFLIILWFVYDMVKGNTIWWLFKNNQAPDSFLYGSSMLIVTAVWAIFFASVSNLGIRYFLNEEK